VAISVIVDLTLKDGFLSCAYAGAGPTPEVSIVIIELEDISDISSSGRKSVSSLSLFVHVTDKRINII